MKLSPAWNAGSLSDEVAQGVAALGAEIYRQDGHALKAFYSEVRPSHIDPYSSAVFTNEKLHTWDERWLWSDSTAGYLISKAKTRGRKKKNDFPFAGSTNLLSVRCLDAPLHCTLEMNERI